MLARVSSLCSSFPPGYCPCVADQWGGASSLLRLVLRTRQKKCVPGAWPDPDSPRRHAHAIESPADLRSDASNSQFVLSSTMGRVGVLPNSGAKTLLSAPARKQHKSPTTPIPIQTPTQKTNANTNPSAPPIRLLSIPRLKQHAAHRTLHTAHRTPHTAHRTPHTVHRRPHTAIPPLQRH